MQGTDVAVVGAGVVGLSAAYALVERGVSVRVYERGVPGNGQSGGESRLFRHAHDDPRLIRYTRESRAVYDAWSEQLGVPLVSGDGAVTIGPAVEQRLPLLEEEGIAARRIDTAELAARVPMLAAYDGPAMLDERGGSIRTGAMIRALTDALGERIVHDEVLSIRPAGSGADPADSGVEVRSGGSTRSFSRVVVCAGRGTERFARSLGLAIPVEHGAQVRLTYAVRGAPPAALSTLQDSSGAFGHDGVYAAAVGGNAAYSVGLGEEAPVREDGSLTRPGDLAELAAETSAYVRRALPGLDPEPIDVRHCWVTTLPWGGDGLGVWESDGVLLAAGNNLFKQAPGLGRKLAAAADGEALPDDLRPEARLGGLAAGGV